MPDAEVRTVIEIVTITATVVAFALGLKYLSWKNAQQLSAFKEAVAQELAALRSAISSEMGHLSAGILKLEARLGSIDDRLRLVEIEVARGTGRHESGT